MNLKIINFANHRNGITGAPFAVVLFEDQGEEGSRKVAILFDTQYHCAVLDVDKLAKGERWGIGGSGQLVGLVVKQYPQIRGTVFDLPRCAESAKGHFDRIGVSDRIEFKPGDFFQKQAQRFRETMGALV